MLQERSLPPVLAAMVAMDQAVAAYNLVCEQLAGAIEQAEHLDEDLRRVPLRDDRGLIATATRLGSAMEQVQRLSWRKEAARREVTRAQQALDEARRTGLRDEAERLRVELEIDAASICEMIGQFEAQLRGRLAEHAKIAEAIEFAARAGGHRQLPAPAATTWAPALATSGPEFWNALASGVRVLQQEATPIAPAVVERPAQPKKSEAAIVTVTATRVDSVPEVIRSPAPAQTSPPESQQQASARGRLERALRALARVTDSRPAPARR